VKDFEIGLHLPKLIIIKHQVSYTFLEHGGFFVPNVMAIFWRGPPNAGVDCRMQVE